MDPPPLHGKTVLQVGRGPAMLMSAGVQSSALAVLWNILPSSLRRNQKQHCMLPAPDRCIRTLTAPHPAVRCVQRFQEDYERKRGTGVPTSINVHERYLAQR